ncbi:MAG: 3'-5' exonuclease [Campylobacteraceae bacterium]|nr:3'-5' exonuclease [Campylobacteraceae bacterium]
MKNFEKIIDKLACGDMSRNHFFKILNSCDYIDNTEINDIESLNCLGLDVDLKKDLITLNTRRRFWQEQRFCIIDIEVNGGSLSDSHIIEIGAVMLKNNEVMEEFHSLIYAPVLNEMIVNLTGITEEMLKDAPSEAQTLEKFRLFLGNSVFVAHNVEFDYMFLSHAYRRHGFPPLLNRKLCTIKFAMRTIKAERYGLQAMREILGLDHNIPHRALWDARSAAEVFKTACQNLPSEIKSTEDLIRFTKNSPAKAALIKQPRLNFDE